MSKETLRDVKLFRISGSPSRIVSVIQIMHVVEERMAHFYDVQTEDHVLQHMIENDSDMDSDFFAELCTGLADDDLWSLGPVRAMYDRVLRHYVLGFNC